MKQCRERETEREKESDGEREERVRERERENMGEIERVWKKVLCHKVKSQEVLPVIF